MRGRWWFLPGLAAVLLAVALQERASAAPVPARASVSELIAASKAAFDNRKYVRADSLAEAACAKLSASRRADPLQHATALVALSRARAARRSLADSVAIRSARQALSLLVPGARERDIVRADAHDVLSLILEEQNHVDQALDHGRRALALRRACFGDTHEEVAESLYRQGVAQMSLGMVDSSLATMRTGLEVRLRLGLARDRRIGDFHSEIAALLEQQGDLDGARAELDACVREYAARLGPDHPAMCQGLQRACIFEYHNGDLARAADLAQRAVATAEAVPGFNPVNLALLRGNLMVALSDLGDFERARRVGAQVVPVYTENLGPNHRQTLWAEAALAETETALGDTAAAAARYRSVCRRFESDPTITSTGALTQARAGLSVILQDSDPQAALALAESAEAAERARPDLNWKTVVDIEVQQLRLQATLGSQVEVARLESAIARDLGAHGLVGTETEAKALVERSLAAAAFGRTREAVGLAHDGAAIARGLLRRDLRALPDREGLTLAGERSAPLDALLGQLVVGSQAGVEVVAGAWDELIRWRGLVGDEMARRRLPAGTSPDSDARRAHDAWTAASRRLAQFEVRNAGDQGEESAARLADLRARSDDAERRWSSVAPRARGDIGGDEAGLASVRAALAPGTALVAFATVQPRGQERRLVAFVLKDGRSAARLCDLGPTRPIEDVLSRWRALAGRSPRGDAGAEQACRQAGLRLRAMTWDVIAPLLGKAGDVMIVADGPLHRLPWGALPAGGDSYLVERGPIIHVLDAERELLRSPSPSGRGLLAVGGVAFAGTSGEAAAPQPILIASTRAMLPDCRQGQALTFAPLPGTEREIEAIAREHATEVQVLRGAAASEAAFKQMAPGRRVLHLATHAVALDDLCAGGSPDARGVGGVAAVGTGPATSRVATLAPSPWLGRRVVLAFAGADAAATRDDENEGLLTAEEVSTLDLQGVDWVVLSACESGLADHWNREGVLGLTRAFRLAGARAVIASQWAVDDDATSEWMTALYRARTRGAAGVGEAMREASREVIKARRAGGRGTHPFYWAAFTATGD